MEEFETLGQLIADYGITGVAALALLLIAYARVFEVRNAGKADKRESAEEQSRIEAQRQAETMRQESLLEQLKLIGRMVSNSEKTANVLDVLLATLATNTARAGEEHERILTIAGQILTENTQTKMTLGGIMNTLNKPEPEPTVADQLKAMRETLNRIDAKIDANHTEVKQEIQLAKTQIETISEQAKHETQETPAVVVTDEPEKPAPAIPAPAPSPEAKPEDKHFRGTYCCYYSMDRFPNSRR
jgi:hypothetical protein